MTYRRFFAMKKGIIILSLVFVSVTSAKITDNKLSTQRLRQMSRVYMASGKYEKAHVLAEKAVKQAKNSNTDISEMALCLIDMGTVCGYEEKLSQAGKFLEEGVQLQKQALYNEHPYVAHTLRMLSDIYRRQGNLEKAESNLSQAVKIMMNNCNINSKEMAPFILESGNLQFEKGNLDQAQINYQAALDIYEQNYGSNHLMTANVLGKMARLYLVREDTQYANALMRQSLSIKSNIFGRYHPMLIDSWLEMARICRKQGQMERSEYYLAKSTETASQSRNAITMAQVYEQVNQIRKQNLIAAASF